MVKNDVSSILSFVILMAKMWIFGFSPGVCPTEPSNLVFSLGCLVSNGRWTLLWGIRFSGSATTSQRLAPSVLPKVARYRSNHHGDSKRSHGAALTVSRSGPPKAGQHGVPWLLGPMGWPTQLSSIKTPCTISTLTKLVASTRSLSPILPSLTSSHQRST